MAIEKVANSVAVAYARAINQNLLIQKRQGEIDKFQRFKAEAAFLTVHNGPVDFERVPKACDGNDSGCAAFTESENKVIIYSNATENYIARHFRVIAHELGHAFNRATGRLAQNMPNNLLRPRNENDVIDWGNIGNDYYGYAGGFDDWQFGYSSPIPGSEEFADMFVGWTYSTWGDSENATRRSQYMENQMLIFLNLWNWVK